MSDTVAHAPKVEVAVSETIATVKTPYGETIATLTVTGRLGFNTKSALHEVVLATRNLLSPDADPVGSTHRVLVPISADEILAAVVETSRA